MFQAKITSVAEQPEKITSIFPAGDEKNLLNPRIDQRLNGIVNHRPVVDRQEVLIGDAGERIQSAAGASRKDYAFHMASFLLSTGVGPGSVMSQIPPY